MALVRRPHHEPQLCILTLARTVPLPSIMTISNQPWYSKFAAHIIFHEDYEIFPNDRLEIGKSSFHRIQLINVRAFFERSAVRARWSSSECAALDRATQQRYPARYRTMCAFWYAEFLNYVERYDYALRIDGDCLLEKRQPDPSIPLPRAISSPHWQGMDSPPVIHDSMDSMRGALLDL